jgi:hypothetical protein
LLVFSASSLTLASKETIKKTLTSDSPPGDSSEMMPWARHCLKILQSPMDKLRALLALMNEVGTHLQTLKDSALYQQDHPFYAREIFDILRKRWDKLIKDIYDPDDDVWDTTKICGQHNCCVGSHFYSSLSF